MKNIANLVILSFKSYDNTIYIEYTDNGKEPPIETKFKKRTPNVENRILAIKGTITFDTKSGKGFKSSILFPK
jgi:signal transduction histidine kinase